MSHEQKIERLSLSNTNRPIDVFKHWQENGYLILSPPYQRGLVWSEARKRNFIRSLLLGIPVGTIVLNDRLSCRGGEWGDWSDGAPHVAAIDGKQRVSAILGFMGDDFPVPGEWFGLRGDIGYSSLPRSEQLHFETQGISCSEGSLPTIEAEKEVFELINFGGVPQGQSDLEQP